MINERQNRNWIIWKLIYATCTRAWKSVNESWMIFFMLFDALVIERLFVLSSYPGDLSSLEHKAGLSLYLSDLSVTPL